jgi:hypothetical protein
MRVPAPLAVLCLLSGCVGDGDNASAASGDADADGFSDAVERMFGSELDNATSVPDVKQWKTVEFSDTVQVVGTGVPTVQCPPDMVNSKRLTWTVEADTGEAREKWATSLTFTLQGAASVNDVDLFVYDPSGAERGSATGSTNQESITIGGKQPLGDWQIEARGCSGAGDVEVTAMGSVEWIPSDAELLEAK